MHYFYQVGDDIEHKTVGWADAFVDTLRRNPIARNFGAFVGARLRARSTDDGHASQVWSALPTASWTCRGSSRPSWRAFTSASPEPSLIPVRDTCRVRSAFGLTDRGDAWRVPQSSSMHPATCG